MITKVRGILFHFALLTPEPHQVCGKMITFATEINNRRQNHGNTGNKHSCADG